MTDQTQSLSGKHVLLTKIVDFIDESGSLQHHKAYLVWRSLSRTNNKIGNAVVARQQTANFANCRNLKDAAAQHLAQCPQLQTVNFAGCRNLTDAAAQHLAQCPQLQTVNFQGCLKLTDAAAQYLTQRHPSISVLASTFSLRQR